jgi:cytoplasmic tRNA 2-thiolation protein 1
MFLFSSDTLPEDDIFIGVFFHSMEICKACVMLEGLNKGKPKLGIGKSSKAMQHMDSVVNDGPKLEPSQIKNIEF